MEIKSIGDKYFIKRKIDYADIADKAIIRMLKAYSSGDIDKGRAFNFIYKYAKFRQGVKNENSNR